MCRRFVVHVAYNPKPTTNHNRCCIRLVARNVVQQIETVEIDAYEGAPVVFDSGVVS